MTNQQPDPEQLDHIKAAWKDFILPGERLETSEDLDRLQMRVKAILRLKSERLEQRLSTLTDAIKTLATHQRRLQEIRQHLETANTEMTKFINVVQRSLTSPS